MDDVRRITAAIASGDPEAFARLYKARFDFVYAVVRRRTGLDEAACLDIVQDAMLKVIRRMKPLPNEAALDAWLRRVALRCAYDHLRRERRLRSRERAAAKADAAPAQSVDPDALDWLRDELGALDRATADLIDLRFRAGLTLGAIGRRVGLSPGAVDGRINRALDTVRKRADQEDRHA
ncbi:MAG: RNA polymerase sigma factor [Phycisphaerales bacterium]